MKTILDLCGGTGAWSKPYKDAGYDVRLVTLPEQDVRLYIPPENVHGILAAPPCTHFAAAGAPSWKKKGDKELLEGLSIVDACLRIIQVCQPKWWVLENPVGRLRRWIGPPRMMFNPCDYGDPYTKKTCLWGNFKEPKKNPVEPIFIVDKRGRRDSSLHYNSFRLPKEQRAVVRSITPAGFAKAFFEANP